MLTCASVPSMHMSGMQVISSRSNDEGETHGNDRKEAIQKTIMAMTLGKDVSSLFPDVLKNIATGDLDQKKLVYLYLM
jgi:vesicle coat complex subunit